MNNTNNSSELNLKITEGMKQVRLNLIAYKAKINSPLVILQEGKITLISAEEYAKLPIQE
ncbi:MAG: hypothetical protein ACRCSG_03190 [Cellulosilyticaceae bacterium]